MTDHGHLTLNPPLTASPVVEALDRLRAAVRWLERAQRGEVGSDLAIDAADELCRRALAWLDVDAGEVQS